MYSSIISDISQSVSVFCDEDNASIPTNPSNLDYKIVLDKVIEEGADCWDGDIPEIVQTHADQRLFAKQLAEYKAAVERLAQYEVAVGREEVTEQHLTGEYEVVEGEVAPVEVMQDVIVVTAIAPVEPTVTRLVYSDDDPMAEPTEETIENPLITTDNAERAAAQAVVDATPQPVKDAAE